MRIRFARACAAWFLVLAPLAGAEVPTPESVIGWKTGEDRKLADWTQIVDYFKKLDAASERVITEDVGKTTQGRPFLVVTITSEANMKRLEEIRRANLRLADPRGLSDEEANRLIATGKTIVGVNHGIHSTEVAANQTSMETAYRLATSQDPAVLDILDKTVIVMLPSHNPDGTQMVVEWYRKSLGTPWEGGNIPFLYHHYTGHDNNRDWYMYTQAESKLTLEHLYKRWRPEIVYDLHQMGQNAARIFAPPFVDPYEPNVDPALVSGINAIGSQMAAKLTAEGKAGVVIHAMYDGWSPARQFPNTYGGIRLLTESASAKMATPVELKFEELGVGIGYDAKKAAWNFPNPWRGGTWRLSDIVSYQISATRALLEHAAQNREFWLRNFLGVTRRASTRQEPYAFVISKNQKDPLATNEMLRVLRAGFVEVQRGKAGFEAGGKSYPAGSFVVSMQQPSSGFAKPLLERQQYPDIRQYPGGPPQRPYDVTAHTLPLLLGVEATAVPKPFAADLEKIEEPRLGPGSVTGKGRYYALSHKNADFVALGRLLKDGVPVRWASVGWSDAGRNFVPGAFLVPAFAKAKLDALAKDLPIAAVGVSTAPQAWDLKKPRVGLYQSWVASMDEGWTRFIFEKEVGLGYETLHDKDIRGGSLAARFDVIILPDQSSRQMVSGFAEGTMPDEYVGGLGKAGVAALKEFAEAGGTLVALNNASEMPIAEMGVPVKNALADVNSSRRRGEGREALGPQSADFYCPGAILRVKVDAANPLAHGLEDPGSIWFEESPAFDLSGGKAVATYIEETPLLSGWLLGGKRLQGKAALAEVPMGKGRVVLFGYRPQYRAQSWSMYMALLNAVYLSSATPAK